MTAGLPIRGGFFYRQTAPGNHVRRDLRAGSFIPLSRPDGIRIPGLHVAAANVSRRIFRRDL
nr:MAG TPA: hypothetical protein [Caudoviricetes sp.]